MDAADAIAASRQLFGLEADDARRLGSSGLATFMLLRRGKELAVMKASVAADDLPACDEMETSAARHAARVDPALPLSLPLAPLPGQRAETESRASWVHPATSQRHCVRLFALLPGRHHEPERDGPLDDRSLRAWGAAAARLGRALRGFAHPQALRPQEALDGRRAAALRPLLRHVADERAAAMCAEALDVLESALAPSLPRLRHQVQHLWNRTTNPLGRLVEAQPLTSVSRTRAQVVPFCCTAENLLFSAVDAPPSGLPTAVSCVLCDLSRAAFAPLVDDVAAALASAGAALAASAPAVSAGDLLRVGRIFLDGYQSVVPLEEEELRSVGDAWLARAAADLLSASNPASASASASSPTHVAALFSQLRALLAAGPAARAARLGLSGPAEIHMLGGGGGDAGLAARAAGLVARRERSIGPGSEALQYGTADPVLVARGEGTWLFDEAGRRYLCALSLAATPAAAGDGVGADSAHLPRTWHRWFLASRRDCYNNVPGVGHAHPRVAAAISAQVRRTTLNMRYLHPSAISLAERLLATLGPGSRLDTVFFVNSGSEANDLAWRMACAFTGRSGGLCTHWCARAGARVSTRGDLSLFPLLGVPTFSILEQQPLRKARRRRRPVVPSPRTRRTDRAYHGISSTAAALTPRLTAPAGFLPDHVERWRPLDTYRSLHAGDGEIRAAAARLRARGHGVACAILDGVLTSEQICDLPAEYVQGLVRATREAGGLWIADEVQACVVSSLPSPSAAAAAPRGLSCCRVAEAPIRSPLTAAAAPSPWAGRARAHGRRDVVPPALRHPSRFRHHRQALGQRPARRRAHHAAGDRRPLRREGGARGAAAPRAPPLVCCSPPSLWRSSTAAAGWLAGGVTPPNKCLASPPPLLFPPTRGCSFPPSAATPCPWPRRTPFWTCWRTSASSPGQPRPAAPSAPRSPRPPPASPAWATSAAWASRTRWSWWPTAPPRRPTAHWRAESRRRCGRAGCSWGPRASTTTS